MRVSSRRPRLRGRRARRQEPSRPDFSVSIQGGEIPAYDSAHDPYCPLAASPGFRAQRRASLQRASLDAFNYKRMEGHRFFGNDITDQVHRPSRITLDEAKDTIDGLEVPRNMPFRITGEEAALSMPPISPMQRTPRSGPPAPVKAITVDLRGHLAAHPPKAPSRGSPGLRPSPRTGRAHLHSSRGAALRGTPGRRSTKQGGRGETERIGEATAAVLGLAVSLDAKLRASDDPEAVMQHAFGWADQLTRGAMEAMEPLSALDLTDDELGLLRELVDREELHAMVRLAKVAALGEVPLEAGSQSDAEASASVEGQRRMPRHHPLPRGKHITVSPVPTPRSPSEHDASPEWKAELDFFGITERRVWRGEVARKMTQSQHRRREASIEYRESIEAAKREHEAKTPRAARSKTSPLTSGASPAMSTSPPPIGDASIASAREDVSTTGDDGFLPPADGSHCSISSAREPRRALSSSRRGSRRGTGQDTAANGSTRPVTSYIRSKGATDSVASRAVSRRSGPPSRRSDPGRSRGPANADNSAPDATVSKQPAPPGSRPARHRVQISAPPPSKRQDAPVERRPATGIDSSRGTAADEQASDDVQPAPAVHGADAVPEAMDDEAAAATEGGAEDDGPQPEQEAAEAAQPGPEEKEGEEEGDADEEEKEAAGEAPVEAKDDGEEVTQGEGGEEEQQDIPPGQMVGDEEEEDGAAAATGIAEESEAPTPQDATDPAVSGSAEEHGEESQPEAEQPSAEVVEVAEEGEGQDDGPADE